MRRANVFDLPRTTVPFIWLFCVTVLIKIDNEEGLYPLFRTCVFAALPFALFHVWGAIRRLRLDSVRWVEVLCLFYLAIYPFATMVFVPLNVRNMKDAAYTLSIYVILTFLVRRYFTTPAGDLDVPAVGTFWTVFGGVQCVIALLFWAGLKVDLGSRLDFSQKIWLDGRLHGLVGTSSHLAPFVAIGALFMLAQPATVQRTLSFGFLFAGLVMTGSRSALLGFCGAASILPLVWIARLRLPVKKVYQVLVVVSCLTVVALFFLEHSTRIVEMAVRTDPAGWEKSRSVMWERRLTEFGGRDMLTQLFGAGHRSQSQTFNTNVEFLVNYGLVYAIVFNAFYFAVAMRGVVRALYHPDSNNVFMAMIAIFVYLFSQGLNPVFSAFVSPIQLAIVFVVMRHFERATAPAVARNPVEPPYPHFVVRPHAAR